MKKIEKKNTHKLPPPQKKITKKQKPSTPGRQANLDHVGEHPVPHRVSHHAAIHAHAASAWTGPRLRLRLRPQTRLGGDQRRPRKEVNCAVARVGSSLGKGDQSRLRRLRIALRPAQAVNNKEKLK